MVEENECITHKSLEIRTKLKYFWMTFPPQITFITKAIIIQTLYQVCSQMAQITKSTLLFFNLRLIIV